MNSVNFLATRCQSPIVTFSLCTLNSFPLKMNNILPSAEFHHLAPVLQDKAVWRGNTLCLEVILSVADRGKGKTVNHLC